MSGERDGVYERMDRSRKYRGVMGSDPLCEAEVNKRWMSGIQYTRILFQYIQLV